LVVAAGFIVSFSYAHIAYTARWLCPCDKSSRKNGSTRLFEQYDQAFTILPCLDWPVNVPRGNASLITSCRLFMYISATNREARISHKARLTFLFGTSTLRI
jgi:hypothetical protein